MRMKNILFTFLGLQALIYSQFAHTCEEYLYLETDELKEYRDALVAEGSDPLDRIFAFRKLSCSESPAIRSFAITEGLKNSADQIVRNEVMLHAMLQKARLEIELGLNDDLSATDRKFVKKNSGILSVGITNRSKTEGCLGFYGKSCLRGRRAIVKGAFVEFDTSNLFGKFELSGSSELVGYLKRKKVKEETGKIPAVIKLY